MDRRQLEEEIGASPVELQVKLRRLASIGQIRNIGTPGHPEWSWLLGDIDAEFDNPPLLYATLVAPEAVAGSCTMPTFVFKANDDAVSHCSCVDQPAMSSGQLDCPWCGCGWLISCSHCQRAFTYAVVRETDVPLIELRRREVAAYGLRSHTEQDYEPWVSWMTEALEPFQIGDIVVYLDGHYLPVGAKDSRFLGYYATHEFEVLPHALARKDPGALFRALGGKAYWLDRARQRFN